MHKKRTKIVCTIGPSSSSEDVLRELIKAGMNMARLNFSHGKHEVHAEFIGRIRRIAEEMGESVAILQDLQGPKIRVGELPEEGVELKAGSEVIFTTGDASIADMRLPVTYDRLHDDVKPGERILMDDGLLSAKVISVKGRDILCKIIDGGILTSHKGINLPETDVSASSITEKDKKDLRFAVEQGVDWVALSFVRTSKEVYDLRYLIKQYEEELGDEYTRRPPIRIIAKIEKGEAVRNINEILDAVDGIMVARGDLGIEMPAEEVPLIQKHLIDKSLERAKPVVVATQMLDSMIRNPRPTRAEVSDVANAVIDHTDAVMLSGETATGKYPVETVKMMVRVIVQAELSRYDDLEVSHKLGKINTTDEAVSEVASILAKDVGAKMILAASLSGDTGRLVSRYRPQIPIHVATDNERVRRQLSVSWGIHPFIIPRCRSVEELVDRSIGYLKKERIGKTGDRIIVVAGEPVGEIGGVNLVEIKIIP